MRPLGRPADSNTLEITSQEDTMQSNTRQPVKIRRHHLDEDKASQRQPRRAPRRTSTRALQIRAALKEA